jgi:hypothetical protein
LDTAFWLKINANVTVNTKVTTVLTMQYIATCQCLFGSLNYKSLGNSFAVISGIIDATNSFQNNARNPEKQNFQIWPVL